MIYLTGDIYRKFNLLLFFTYQNKKKVDDILIILGYTGINCNARTIEDKLKEK